MVPSSIPLFINGSVLSHKVFDIQYNTLAKFLGLAHNLARERVFLKKTALSLGLETCFKQVLFFLVNGEIKINSFTVKIVKQTTLSYAKLRANPRKIDKVVHCKYQF